MDRYAKSAIALVGCTVTGYILMRTTEPTKEQIMDRLPADLKTPEKLKAQEELNERIMASLKATAYSKEPIWKMKIDDPFNPPKDKPKDKPEE